MQDKLEDFKKELLRRMKERDKDSKLEVKSVDQPFQTPYYVFKMTAGNSQVEYFHLALQPTSQYIRVFYR